MCPDFSPLPIIEKNEQQFKQNPYKKRGRGLILTARNADSFEPINKNKGVKVVFYKSAAEFKIHSLGDKEITIIEITEGIFAPSFEEKLIAVARNYLHTNLILDFSHWGVSVHSSAHSAVVIELNDLYEGAGKK